MKFYFHIIAGKLQSAIRKVRFQNRLAFYLTLFGIFIGYVSFMIHAGLAVCQMGTLMSRMIDDHLAAEAVEADVIETLINTRDDGRIEKFFPVSRFLYGQNPLIHGSAVIKTFYYSNAEKVWYKVYHDRSDILRRKKIHAPDPELLPTGRKNRIKINSGVYSGFSEKISIMIDITGERDRNRYLHELMADKKSVVRYLGGAHILAVYGAVILLLSVLLSRLISLHVARPINRLSEQAEKIASGDLEVRTRVPSEDELGGLSRALNHMAGELKKYISDIEENLEAISVMNRIDKAVLSSVSSSDLVDRVTSYVSGLYSDCVVGLAIRDDREERYRFLSRYRKGIRDDESKSYITFPELGPDYVEMSRKFFVFAYSSDKENVNRVNGLFTTDFRYVVNLPIYLEEIYTGSLLIGRDEEQALTGQEISALKALADQVGVALKSVRYLEDRENLYLGMLASLSKAIDAKSRWTAGHSSRVALYCEKIARAMGRDEEFIHNLNISALLHDIGKIGVPESVLDKPGRLTEEEFSLIKEHPERGVHIISEIPGYETIGCGIRCHHEDYDGKGYPAGLSGEEIPVQGRIIAVADVYDSLISDRPYRKGMDMETALKIMNEEKGKRFDPEITDIFLKLIIP